MLDTLPDSSMAYAIPVEIRLTEEEVRLPDRTRMGLLGLYYLRPLAPNWVGGVAVFGSTEGEHAGFFGWGVTAAYQVRQGPWRAEAGVFAGGGGGGPSWVGGGLLLRPHVAVSRTWGNLSVGAGVSELWTPSGVVHSAQPFVAASWSHDVLFGPPGVTASPPTGTAFDAAMPSETAGIVGRYAMRTRSVSNETGGTSPDLRYGGIVLRRALSGGAYGVQPYWTISAAGSLTHAYTGYAEFLGGVGAQYAVPLLPALSLRVEASAGSGGDGGALDAGGGVLRKVSAGAVLEIGPQFTIGATAGRLASGGRFNANEVRLEVGVRGWDVVPGDVRSSGAAPAALEWAPWTVATEVDVYARMRRNGGATPALATSALNVERELDGHWRMVGGASVGIDGNAGGFAIGQLGLGWLSTAPADAGWRIGAQATLGAAGGGGVSTGGGLIGQVELQARYTLSPSWALQSTLGWLRSKDGALSTPMAGISAVYAFSRLQGRP